MPMLLFPPRPKSSSESWVVGVGVGGGGEGGRGGRGRRQNIVSHVNYSRFL